MNKILRHIALPAAALACVLGFARPSDAGFLEALTDTTSTALTIHVGSPHTGSLPTGISGPVAVGASVAAPSTIKYLSLDKRALSINVNPGQSATLICPLTLSVSSHGAAWVLSTVKVILTNNFHDWDFMARDMSIRIYQVGARPTRPFMKLIDFVDNNSEFTSFLNNRADSTWNSSYCVDLQLAVPASVAPGDYYNTLSWALYRSETFHGHTTPTPMPTPTPTPTPTPPPHLFVANAPNAVRDFMVFPSGASGNVAPSYTISSSSSSFISNPMEMRTGPDGNIYEVNYNEPWILVFAPTAQGASTPLRQFWMSSTGYTGSPQALAFDGSGNAYVAFGVVGIVEFPAGATGTVTPVAAWPGSFNGTISTNQIDAAEDVAVLPNGTMYVPNTCSDMNCRTFGSILIFAPGSNGSSAPTNTIAGANTSVTYPYGIDADAAGNIYVLTEDNYYGANAIGNVQPSINPRILVFAAGSTGNVAPVRTIVGSLTGLQAPTKMRVDKSGGIYVADYLAQAVYYYAPGANGNIAPTRVLQGANTGFSINGGIQAVGF